MHNPPLFNSFSISWLRAIYFHSTASSNVQFLVCWILGSSIIFFPKVSAVILGIAFVLTLLDFRGYNNCLLIGSEVRAFTSKLNTIYTIAQTNPSQALQSLDTLRVSHDMFYQPPWTEIRKRLVTAIEKHHKS